MQIPSLPTDNLYKFLAIFGLALLIVSVFAPHSYIRPLVLEGKEAKAQGEICKLEVAALEEEIERLKKGKEDSKLSEERLRELKEKNRQLQKTLIELKIKAEWFDLLIKYADFYGRLSNFGWFLGVLLLFVGFGLWYVKVQRYQDAILEAQYKEAIKPKSEKDKEKGR